MPAPRLGLVVHPTRDLGAALAAVRSWADGHGVPLRQVADGPREVAPRGAAVDCDAVLALGGDGTVLAALHAAQPAGVPVLGVACGSVGALTTVPADALPAALDALAAGETREVPVPALRIAGGGAALAFNDLVVVRAGAGQIGAEVLVDGVLYGRVAGDGVVVSTELGSSAYGMAVGGPILMPGTGAFAVTALAPHGGCVPPLVAGAATVVDLVVDPGHGGARCEVDGRPAALAGHELRIALEPDAARLLRVGGDEPYLSALRRRGIIGDSPRVLAHDARVAAAAARAAAEGRGA